MAGLQMSDRELHIMGQAMVEQVLSKQGLIQRLEAIEGIELDILITAEEELTEAVNLLVKVFPQGVPGYEIDVSVQCKAGPSDIFH